MMGERVRPSCYNRNMDKPTPLSGIHHLTAIASDPQRNLDFYTRSLGLRLVKKTVNFDDPGTYHFYFGDAHGSPGSILTFFPWPGARRGRQGVGQVAAIAFAVPEEALGYWQQRLKSQGITNTEPFERFDQQVLALLDPDGLALELVGTPGSDNLPAWDGGGVPPEHAIRGFHSPTLLLEGFEHTDRLLTALFGLQKVSEARSGCRVRYQAPGRPAFRPGSLIDLDCRPSERPGQMGAGAVHHIALRVPDDAAQLAWRERLVEAGYNVTPVMDRQYFHSIYFREPGGILFELATDPPGFSLDEDPQTLGQALKLPPWLEPSRAMIESALPPITTG
jgi:glyoxalase family protein